MAIDPDVENAVHSPLTHITGFSHLNDTNMAASFSLAQTGTTTGGK